MSLMFLVVKFFVSFYHLFQCEKNILESTDGLNPQLTVQRWRREGVQQSRGAGEQSRDEKSR